MGVLRKLTTCCQGTEDPNIKNQTHFGGEARIGFDHSCLGEERTHFPLYTFLENFTSRIGVHEKKKKKIKSILKGFTKKIGTSSKSFCFSVSNYQDLVISAHNPEPFMKPHQYPEL